MGARTLLSLRQGQECPCSQKTGDKSVLAPRRRLIALGLCLLTVGTAFADGRHFMSPDGTVDAALSVDAAGQLVYALAFRGKEAVAPSPIGLTLDGKDLGRVKSLTAVNVREVHERFPTRGAHSEARYDALVALFTVTPREGEPYGVQVSVANEGFAWRLLVAGTGARRVNAETACWRLPPESRVWFGERRSDWKLKSYAGEWISALLRDLHAVSPQGPVQTMPIVAELPELL